MKRNEQLLGPHTAEQPKEAAVSNTLRPNDQIANTGASSCVTASNVSALEFPPPSTQPESGDLLGGVAKRVLRYPLTNCNLVHGVHPPLHLQRILITCSERNRLLPAYDTQKAPLLFSHHAGNAKLISHDL